MKLTKFTSLLALLLLLGNSIVAQSNFDVELLNVTHSSFQTNYLNGYVKVSYTPGDDAGWLNIGAQDEDTFEFGMIVLNQYLPSSSEVEGSVTYTIPFNLSNLSTDFPDGKSTISKSLDGRTRFTLYVHVLKALGYNYNDDNHVDTKTGVMVMPIVIDASNGIPTGSPPDNVTTIDNSQPAAENGDPVCCK